MYPVAYFKRLVLLACVVRLAYAECYYPDGSVIPELKYAGCSSVASDGFTACCALLVPFNGAVNDTCTHFGLCQHVNLDMGGSYWRAYCTDRTWNSPACLKNVCPAGGSNLTQEVTNCVDGKFCCGDKKSTEKCCKTGRGFALDAVLSLPQLETGSNNKTSMSIKQKPNLPISSIVGISLGIIFGLGMILLLIAYLRLKRRSKEAHAAYNRNLAIVRTGGELPTELAGDPRLSRQNAKFELNGDTRNPAELDIKRLVELDGNKIHENHENTKN